MSLEYTVNDIAQTFQQETKESIKNIVQQISQLATSISRLESQGKLHAQPESTWNIMFVQSAQGVEKSMMVQSCSKTKKKK